MPPYHFGNKARLNRATRGAVIVSMVISKSRLNRVAQRGYSSRIWTIHRVVRLPGEQRRG